MKRCFIQLSDFEPQHEDNNMIYENFGMLGMLGVGDDDNHQVLVER